MADDINVTFGADTTQLDAAIGKVKRETQSLVPGAPGSGILTPLPAAFGGAPATLLEKATVAAKANAAAAAQAGTAMKNYGLELEEAGKKARRAGIDFGAMSDRMAGRLVIFEAIRLVIKAIKYAIDEISNVQQAQIKFNAMADGLDHLDARFKQVQKDAAEALIPPEKGVQIIQTLQDYGATANQAGMYVKALGEWSHVLGVDANTLAQALGRVSEGEGSLQDMRLVTHMMGEQSAAGRELIQTIVDMTEAQKNLVAENATVEKSMQAVMRATKEMVEDAERQTDRQMSLIEKLAAGEAKKAAAGGGPSFAMPGFAKGAIAPRGPPDIGRALEFGGMIGGMQVQPEAMAQYQRGLEEIGRLEGRNAAFVRAQVHDKILGWQDVMRAGRESTDDQMRGLDRIDEANRAHAEFQKTSGEARIAGAKAEFARAGPQAVIAPPVALFAEYANSFKGMGDQFKAALDDAIQKFAKGVQELATPTTELSKNLSHFIDLLAGAG